MTDLETPDTDEPDEPDDTEEPTEIDPDFERLLAFLKESRSFDFTGYKRPSLMRRVRHRMREIDLAGFDEYQDRLQLDPDEFTALFNTILINVTSFFRDADAWEVLRDEIIPTLLRNSDGAPIRVWSAGCAAGQEAYSIAMLLHEAMGSAFRDRVKIYATDVDEDALNHARQASYSERELRGLPESYRDRYFEPVGSRWVCTPDLRRSVIFGRNDLTSDAPISRIDLLLCRNTLMYFNNETQAHVVSRLGFALRRNGTLFLGKAEMLLNHASVFDAVDLKRRFFRRVRHDVVEPVGLPLASRSRGSAFADTAAQLRNEIVLTNPVAQIAVTADGRLVMVNHRASAMLGISERDVGRPFQDLEVSYRPLELRSQLASVAETRTPIWLREIEWRRSRPEPVYVDVHVVPLIDPTGVFVGASISFTDVTRFRALRVEVEATNRQLESAYEELQSTNEELETMNEELQSANDELQTSNEQLRERTLEVTDLNAFMQSILGSLEAAVIVLDRDLVVQVWTPQARDLWGLRADETVGQHLLNLDSGLPLSELRPWLRAVISGGEAAVTGQLVQAVNRRGRAVTLRVTVSALDSGSGLPAGALVQMEDVSDLEQAG